MKVPRLCNLTGSTEIPPAQNLILPDFGPHGIPAARHRLLRAAWLRNSCRTGEMFTVASVERQCRFPGMTHRHDIAEIEKDRDRVCRAILEALPDWFGIPEALENYVRDVKTMAVLGCRRDGRIVGMVALHPTSEATLDMHVIGVLRPYHGQGIGRALVEAAAERARADGMSLLSVKTLGPSHPDPHYAATRAFYLSVGFLPVEEFKDLWSEENPCLLMIKPLG